MGLVVFVTEEVQTSDLVIFAALIRLSPPVGSAPPASDWNIPIRLAPYVYRPKTAASKFTLEYDAVGMRSNRSL